MISMFFASLFRVLLLHQFSKDFETDFVYFLCIFDTFFVCARNLLNLQKPLFLQWICMFLHIRKSWFVMIYVIFFAICFGVLIFDKFGHRFCIHSGTRLVSNSMFVRWSFYIFLLHDIFIDLGAKFGPGCGLGCSPFHHFFDLVPQVVFFEGSLAHCGSLLAPFWLPFCLNVGSSGYPFCSILNIRFSF